VGRCIREACRDRSRGVGDRRDAPRVRTGGQDEPLLRFDFEQSCSLLKDGRIPVLPRVTAMDKAPETFVGAEPSTHLSSPRPR
jgi:hypothetical protein